MPEYIRFGGLFEKFSGGDAMKYDKSFDIDPGVGWNSQQTDMGSSFSAYFTDTVRTKLTFTLETAYFGDHGDIISQSKMIAAGRAFARALKEYDAEIKE